MIEVFSKRLEPSSQHQAQILNQNFKKGAFGVLAETVGFYFTIDNIKKNSQKHACVTEIDKGV